MRLIDFLLWMYFFAWSVFVAIIYLCMAEDYQRKRR